MKLHPVLAECMEAMPKETWEHPLGRPPRAVRKRMFLQVEPAQVRRGKTTRWFVWAIERTPGGAQGLVQLKTRAERMVFASGAALPETMEEAATKLAAALEAAATARAGVE